MDSTRLAELPVLFKKLPVPAILVGAIFPFGLGVCLVDEHRNFGIATLAGLRNNPTGETEKNQWNPANTISAIFP